MRPRKGQIIKEKNTGSKRQGKQPQDKASEVNGEIWKWERCRKRRWKWEGEKGRGVGRIQRSPAYSIPNTTRMIISLPPHPILNPSMPPSLSNTPLLSAPAPIPRPSNWESPAPAVKLAGSFGPGLCCPQAVLLGTARVRGGRGGPAINGRISLGETPGAGG